ncbi:MAG: hypothetical protein ACP5HG_01370 [Anaerolineae bacterium]
MSQPKVSVAARIKGARTPGEELRGTLSRLEARVGRLTFAESDAPAEILVLLDRADTLMQALAAEGFDLQAERSRFITITQQFRKKGKAFLRQIGGSEALQGLREEAAPPDSNWWWYIDRVLSEERRVRRARTLRTVAIAAVVLAVLTGLYMLFLAPDEATRERYLYEQRAERALSENDPMRALDEVAQALTYAPNDPDLLVLQGVSYRLSGLEDEAETSFAAAQAAASDLEIFYATRSQAYMLANRPELALEDAQEMVKLYPDSAVAHLQMGSVNQALGNYVEASSNYEKASELARASGNSELEGIARVQLANVTMLMSAPQLGTPSPTTRSSP